MLGEASLWGAALFVLAVLGAGTRHWGRADDMGGEPWLLGWLGAFLLVLGGLGTSIVSGEWRPAFRVIALVPLLAPWGLARAVAIPFGWWRVAAALGFLSGWTWRGHVRSAAVVAAAEAATAARMRDHPRAERGRAWVRARVDRLDAASALARAHLYAAEGRTELARALIDVVGDFDPTTTPMVCRSLAVELRAGLIAPPTAARPRAVVRLAERWAGLELSDAADSVLRAMLDELVDRDPESTLVRAAIHDHPRALRWAARESTDPLVVARAELRLRLDRAEERWRRSRHLGQVGEGGQVAGPTGAELDAWAELRGAFERARGRRAGVPALGGDRAWHATRPDVERFAIALWISGTGRQLGVAILRWLHDRALEHDDTDAANAARRNLTMAA